MVVRERKVPELLDDPNDMRDAIRHAIGMRRNIDGEEQATPPQEWITLNAKLLPGGAIDPSGN